MFLALGVSRFEGESTHPPTPAKAHPYPAHTTQNLRKIMADTSTKSKIMFLGRWIGVNLVGWIAGAFSGLCLGEFYLAPILSLSFDSPIADGLAPLLVWLPPGIGVGIMQSLIMKRWKIQSVLWMIATSLGLGIPATLIAWYHDNIFVQQFGYGGPSQYWFYGFGIVLVATGVGLAQMLVMGTAFSKRALWIVANVLGVVICLLLWVVVIFSSMSLLPPESSLGARTSGFLVVVISLSTLPFMGIIPSLATGLYLLKYGSDAIDDKGSDLTNSTLLNPQAG
jgi:hypothetical protein